MSETTAAKRRYNKILPSHLEYAMSRFHQLASTSAVRAELKSDGGAEYSYNQLHYHWKRAQAERRALAAAGDAQGGGE